MPEIEDCFADRDGMLFPVPPRQHRKELLRQPEFKRLPFVRRKLRFRRVSFRMIALTKPVASRRTENVLI